MHSIENEFLVVKSKEQGAELTSIVLKETGREYLWQAEDLWQKHSPILFPVVGNLKNGKITVNKKDYALKNHGFARDLEFELIEKDQTSITYQLSSSNETLKVYPFNFNLFVTYTLKRHTLDVNFEVENTNQDTMYFSIGGHPAFNCNSKDEEFSDYFLEFEKEETASIFRKDKLIADTGTPFLKNTRILKLDKKVFSKDALIFKNLQSSFVRLKNKDGTHEVKVTFEKFPVFIIWSKGDRFVCLEPCFGCDDSEKSKGDISKKDKIVKLQAGEVFDNSYQIKIK